MRIVGLRPALRTVAWGAGLGVLILGGGSRLAMHAVSVINTGTGGFTLGGTFTVVFLGLASGVLGGVILVAVRALVRGRWTPATTVLFWIAILAITLRGLSPVDGQRLALFLPVIVLFGVLLQWKTRPTRAAPVEAGENVTP